MYTETVYTANKKEAIVLSRLLRKCSGAEKVKMVEQSDEWFAISFNYQESASDEISYFILDNKLMGINLYGSSSPLVKAFAANRDLISQE